MQLGPGSNVLVAIDPKINLLDGLWNQEARPDLVCWLRPDNSEVAQITQALVAHPTVTTLHLLSHGQPGCLHLGDLQISWKTLGQYAPAIRQWSRLAALETIIIYGCEVARGPIGRAFIAALRELTGAAIAASTTPIGAAHLGGNWDLDYQLGQPQWALPCSLETLQTYPGLLGVPEIKSVFVGDRAVLEDGVLTFPGITISDTGPTAGDPPELQTVTLSVAAGTLTLTSLAGLSNLTGNNTSSQSSSV
jgi:hypothetical protein